jgi:hypothetical protein
VRALNKTAAWGWKQVYSILARLGGSVDSSLLSFSVPEPVSCIVSYGGMGAYGLRRDGDCVVRKGAGDGIELEDGGARDGMGGKNSRDSSLLKVSNLNHIARRVMQCLLVQFTYQ